MGLPILNMDGYLLKQIKAETARATAADASLQSQIDNINLNNLAKISTAFGSYLGDDLELYSGATITETVNDKVATTDFASFDYTYSISFPKGNEERLIRVAFEIASKANQNVFGTVSAKLLTIGNGFVSSTIFDSGAVSMIATNTQGGPTWSKPYSVYTPIVKIPATPDYPITLKIRVVGAQWLTGDSVGSETALEPGSDVRLYKLK